MLLPVLLAVLVFTGGIDGRDDSYKDEVYSDVDIHTDLLYQSSLRYFNTNTTVTVDGQLYNTVKLRSCSQSAERIFRCPDCRLLVLLRLQSSCSKAYDGVGPLPTYSHLHCAMLGPDPGWWQADTVDFTAFKAVTIIGGVSRRLNDFKITVDHYITCVVHKSSTGFRATLNYPCIAYGRQLRITSNLPYLVLCEVLVFGKHQALPKYTETDQSCATRSPDGGIQATAAGSEPACAMQGLESKANYFHFKDGACKVSKSTFGMSHTIIDAAITDPCRAVCIGTRLFCTLQQRRIHDGAFNRDWAEYVKGFGDGSNFWQGLEWLHRMTSKPGKRVFRVELTDWYGILYVTEYAGFVMHNASTNYTMDYGALLPKSSNVTLPQNVSSSVIRWANFNKDGSLRGTRLLIQKEVSAPLVSAIPKYTETDQSCATRSPDGDIQATAAGYESTCAVQSLASKANYFHFKDGVCKVSKSPFGMSHTIIVAEMDRCREVCIGTRRFCVLQQHLDDSVPFNFGWADYVNGFGTSRNFWRGLEWLHRMTSKPGNVTFRAEFTDWDNESFVAEYSGFKVHNASTNYTMDYDALLRDSSNVTYDSLSVARRRQFSTIDRDNDNDSGSCSRSRGEAGWWFSACGDANPNGRYRMNSKILSTPVYMHWRRFIYYDDLKLKEIRLLIQRFS